MSEHLSEEQIERYRAQTLSPAEKLLVARHLAACDRCNVRPRAMASPPAAIAALRKNLRPRAREDLHHLDYQMMEAYVDKRVDAIDTEIVESHLELCAACAAELKELQAFAAMVREQKPRKAEAQTPAPSWWARLMAGLGLSSGAAVWRVAGAAAVAGLLVALGVVIFGLYRASLMRDRGEVAEIRNAASPAGQKAAVNSNRANPNPNPPNNHTEVATLHPPKADPYIIDLPLSRGAGDGEVYRVPPDRDTVIFRAKVHKEAGKKYEGRLVRANGSLIPLGIVNAAADGRVIYSVPTAKLAAGDYVLQVYRAPREGNEDDEVASIPMQIRK